MTPIARPKLDGFEFLEYLGGGAFGQVWKTRDVKMNVFRAVKVLPKDRFRECDARRLLREAQTVAQLPKHRNRVAVTVGLGLVIGLCATAYQLTTGRPYDEVLFSGQAALPPLVQHAASYTAGALLLLVVCKGLAYIVSLAAFRGGPTFPALLIGAAGGIGLSHLPGLPMVAGAAMGIGAMSAVMLTLPLTSVLLAAILLGSDGLAVTPLVIVAVVVAYVATARMTPDDSTTPAGPAQPATAGATAAPSSS